MILREVSDQRRARIIGGDDHRVVIQMHPTIKSWGEYVTVDLHEEEESRTRLTVTSWPVLRTTILDYGKNSANVSWLLNLPAVSGQI